MLISFWGRNILIAPYFAIIKQSPTLILVENINFLYDVLIKFNILFLNTINQILIFFLREKYEVPSSTFSLSLCFSSVFYLLWIAYCLSRSPTQVISLELNWTSSFLKHMLLLSFIRSLFADKDPPLLLNTT